MLWSSTSKGETEKILQIVESMNHNSIQLQWSPRISV